MAFHHVALATRDIDATHRFYTEVMGFTLVKAVVAPTPNGGWARHVFYDTSDGMIAGRNIIGRNPLNTTAVPNSGYGIRLDGSTNSVVGGKDD